MGGAGKWPEKQWQWSKDRVDQALKAKELVFTKRNDGWTVDYKQYLRNELGEVRGSKLYSLLEGPYTQVGTAEIEELFGNGKIFTFPKPSSMIRHLLGCGGKDDIVLDFFAGSAATAHAVLALNAEDGGTCTFRTSPRRIWSKLRPYTHAIIRFPNKLPLEAHLGIMVQGSSGALNKADVAVIPWSEGEWCRKQ